MLEKNNLFLSGAFHKKVLSCLFVAHHQTCITTKTQVVFHDSAFPGLRHQRWILHQQISAWLKVKRGSRSQFLDGKKRQNIMLFVGLSIRIGRSYWSSTIWVLDHSASWINWRLTVLVAVPKLHWHRLLWCSLMWHPYRIRSGRTAKQLPPIFFRFQMASASNCLILKQLATSLHFMFKLPKLSPKSSRIPTVESFPHRLSHRRQWQTDLVSFPRQVRFTVQRTGAALRSQAGGQAPSANAKIGQRGEEEHTTTDVVHEKIFGDMMIWCIKES